MDRQYIESTQASQQARSNGAGWLRDLIAAPFIYGMVIPIALLDLSLGIYQHICFRAWRIPQVRRADYFQTVRYKLRDASLLDRLNCIYCEYANGVFAYAREVVGRTEQYWCPVRNAARKDPHTCYADFVHPEEMTDFITSRAATRSSLCESCSAETRACTPFMDVSQTGGTL